MAGLLLTASTTNGNTTGTAKITVLQVVAPANQNLVIKKVFVGFKHTSPTAEPPVIELAHQSSTPSGADSVTPAKVDQDDATTVQSSASELFDGSDQPTEDAVVEKTSAHTQHYYEYIAPPGGGIKVRGGKMFGVAVTSPADIEYICTIWYEE